MPVRVYETDSYFDTALKIFNGFEIHQSCKVIGLINFDGKIMPKGQAVWNEIKRLDDAMYCDDKGRRKKVFPKNGSGAPEVQKLFKFAEREENEIPIYTIWRAQ